MPYSYRKGIVYRFGERGSGLHPIGPIQDFYSLRDMCLANGTLFEDPDFVAENSSIFFSKTPNRLFEWRRPMEIINDPVFFVEGVSKFEFQQGELGNCWLIAAVANLTLRKTLFRQVVPDDQGFSYKYAGIFHFRFWQNGNWVDVVIDDRLPTVYGKLVFMRSSEDNEFGSALLEKAYAKLHGSYEALKEGTICEAMEDFTGGVTEMYELNHAPPTLYKIMLTAFNRTSIMGCSIEPDPNNFEACTPQGLVKGPEYNITMVKYVDIPTPGRTGKIPLLRLRNLWRNEMKWNGSWSVKSPEWRCITDRKRKEIGLTLEADGEFWMSFRDFENYFSHLEICNLNPDSVDEEMLGRDKKRWEMSMFEGEWVRGVTAGGCRDHLETFCHNPQYRIDPDEDDGESICTVIVSLMQKNRRSQRRMGVEVLTIGFAMYHLNDPDNLPRPLGLDFFKHNQCIARSPSFINIREVTCRFKLSPGVYCIVPSTFEPNEEGEFILRVFSENKNNMEENDVEVDLGEIDPRFSVEPEEQKGEDKVKEFFCKVAGEEMEVDWMELKEVLDHALRKEVPRTSTESQGSFISLFLSILCGSICRDTPLGQAFDPRREVLSKDVCRSMVAMMDVGKSGKIGYAEFKDVWRDIHIWMAVFQMYDEDGSGSISAFELRHALNSAGCILNMHVLNILVHRYGTKNGTISFDDFVMCVVKLKAMIVMFKERDPNNTKSATFTMEEWIEKSIYS